MTRNPQKPRGERIRFWAFVNGDRVRLALRQGVPVSHSEYHRTEEGYYARDEQWLLEGDSVRHTLDTSARDCDGPLYTHVTEACGIEQLEARTVVDGEQIYRWPAWQVLARGQRDVFAEAAGY